MRRCNNESTVKVARFLWGTPYLLMTTICILYLFDKCLTRYALSSSFGIDWLVAENCRNKKICKQLKAWKGASEPIRDKTCASFVKLLPGRRSHQYCRSNSSSLTSAGSSYSFFGFLARLTRLTMSELGLRNSATMCSDISMLGLNHSGRRCLWM